MASESDNPFARNSPWPQMPQAPFRVGPLPKAEPPARPEPKTVTPVFTRPAGPPAFAGLSQGGAVPRALPSRRPPTPPAPEPAPAPPPTVAAPPPAVFEVTPVVVQPHGSAARKLRRRSPVPAIAATAAGLAAVLGISYALNRGQAEALRSPVAPPAAAIAIPPAPVVAATAPPAPSGTVAPAPAKVAATPRVASARITPPARLVTPPPPVAAEEAASAPLISLPPPAPTPPQPAYVPPPEPDPNAPMATQRPY